jgi:hypothetical protein
LALIHPIGNPGIPVHQCQWEEMGTFVTSVNEISERYDIVLGGKRREITVREGADAFSTLCRSTFLYVLRPIM